MKKLLLLLYIALTAFGCNDEQKRIDKMATKMANNVNTACQLSADQQTKVKAAAREFDSTKIVNIDKYAKDQEVLLNLNNIARTTYIGKLKTILTPDQLDKLKAWHEQHKDGQQGKESE